MKKIFFLTKAKETLLKKRTRLSLRHTLKLITMKSGFINDDFNWPADTKGNFFRKPSSFLSTGSDIHQIQRIIISLLF